MPADARNSIAHIQVLADGKLVSRGSGFAIGSELVVTCLHVVADRTATPPVPFGEIRITFRGHPPIVGTFQAWDSLTDWALLRCKIPDDVPPLILRPAAEGDAGAREWWTWGFPDLNAVDGQTIEGSILNLQGTFAKSAPAIELYSEQAKAMPVHGISGAPCIKSDFVIGLIRTTLEESKLSFGTFYATPAAELLKAAELRDAFVNPYQGLKPFSEERSPFFFGRQKDIGDLVARLAASQDRRLLTLLGASGSGKSSLLMAGLVPSIRAGQLIKTMNWVVVKMRPGVRPVHNLTVQLRQIESHKFPPFDDLKSWLERGGDALSNAVDEELAARKGDWGILLVVDQLEELFTQGATPSERDTFLELLVGAASTRGGRTWVLTSMRADLLGPLGDSRLARDINESAVIVGPVGVPELEAVVRGPAERVGLLFDDNLVEALLREVRGGSNDLPLLQFALDFLWRNRAVNRMTWGAWGAMGGLRGAIARRADEIFVSSSEDRQLVASRLFLRLVRIGDAGAPDTRRTASHAELAAIDPNYRTALAPFVDERLLVGDDDGFEIAHEAIIAEWGRLRGWLDKNRLRGLAEQNLAKAFADWEAAEHATDQLLAGRALRFVLDPLSDTLDKQPVPMVQFLLRSVIKEDRDLASWLRRFPTLAIQTAVAASIAEGRASEAVRVLRASGTERAPALDAEERLFAILKTAESTATADLAAVAIADLGLTPRLVQRVETEGRSPEGVALWRALAYLRNVPVTGVQLETTLPKPLLRRVRRGAALRLAWDHRAYLLTLGATTFLVATAITQLLPFVDTLVNAEGSIPVGVLDLVAMSAVAAWVLLRNQTDRRPVGTRAAISIGLIAFLLGNGGSVLARLLKISVQIASGGDAMAARHYLVDALMPWTEVATSVVLALFFRGADVRRPSLRRVFAFASLVSLIGTLDSRFSWWLLTSALTPEKQNLTFEIQEILLQLLYGVLLISAALVAFIEIGNQYRANEQLPRRDWRSTRRFVLILGAVAGLTIVFGRVSPWFEDRFIKVGRLERGRKFMYRGGRDLPRGIHLLEIACEEERALEGCKDLARHYESTKDPTHAAHFFAQSCDLGDQYSCSTGARLAAEAHDKETAQRLYLRTCEWHDYSCIQAARLEPEGSERRLELAMYTLKPGGPRPTDPAEVLRELNAALKSTVTPKIAELGERLCKQSVPQACVALASALERDGDVGRANTLLARGCESGYAVACLARPQPVSAPRHGAANAPVAQLCADGDDAACARATPATLHAVADILWKRGELLSSLDQRRLACDYGDQASCAAWGESSVLLWKMREAQFRVPTALANRYAKDPSVTVVRLPASLFGDTFQLGHQGYSFARQAYGSRNIEIEVANGSIRFCEWREKEARWSLIDDAPADWTASPLVRKVFSPDAIKPIAGATYAARLACVRESEFGVLFHIESIEDDGSLILAWKFAAVAFAQGSAEPKPSPM